MPLLYVPPPLVISSSPEWKSELKRSIAASESLLVGQLAFLSPKKVPAKSFGSKTPQFEISGKDDLVAQASFLLEPGKQQRIVARFVTLMKVSNCQVLGSVWEKGDSPLSLPQEVLEKSPSLQTIAQRSFPNKMPLSFQLSFASQAGQTLEGAWLRVVPPVLLPVLSEHFASQGQLVFQAQDRRECGLGKRNAATPSEDLAKRPHRVLQVRLELSEQDKPNVWPQIKTSAKIMGSVLGEDQGKFFEDKLPEPFRPDKISQKLLAPAAAHLLSLEAGPVQISRRFGKWVFLKKGRTYGLKIGMHLQGPRGARLHMIQWLGTKPEEKPREGEESVALVRKESDGALLKEGDEVWIDPSQYPEAALSGSLSSPKGSLTPPP